MKFKGALEHASCQGRFGGKDVFGVFAVHLCQTQVPEISSQGSGASW